MAKWTGEWLSGNSNSAETAESPRWRGEKLGLPEKGAGSIAGGGSRFLALILELLLASLVTSGFHRPDFGNPAVMQVYNLWAVGVWAAISVVSVALFSFTPGMAAVGIRVGRLDGASFIGPLRALVRTTLTFVIIPAAIRDSNGRSWSDRLTGTAVVRLR